MTVLILASELDPQADVVVNELTTRDVPVFRIDTARFPTQLDIDVELRGGRWTGRLVTPHRALDLAHVRSVWYRSPTAFSLPNGMSQTEKRWAATESKYGLGGVLASLPVLYVNHPNCQADASYKPAQLMVAAQLGLRVPDTMITNSEDAVRRFAAAEGRPIVWKSFALATITEEGRRKAAFTRVLDSDDFDSLSGVGLAAHQFQAWVPKDYDARTVVMGDKSFSFSIRSTSAAGKVDFRRDYDALSYEWIETPPHVHEALMEFNRRFGLTYAAFDFAVDMDDVWWFFEANAGGQYGWLENKTSAPLTATLVDLLAGSAAGCEADQCEPEGRTS